MEKTNQTVQIMDFIHSNQLTTQEDECYREMSNRADTSHSSNVVVSMFQCYSTHDNVFSLMDSKSSHPSSSHIDTTEPSSNGKRRLAVDERLRRRYSNIFYDSYIVHL